MSSMYIMLLGFPNHHLLGVANSAHVLFTVSIGVGSLATGDKTSPGSSIVADFIAYVLHPLAG